jgi:dTDP-4-amino-4,6-dideoxygalactose transaminase
MKSKLDWKRSLFPLPLIQTNVPSWRKWRNHISQIYKSERFTNSGNLSLLAEELLLGNNNKSNSGLLVSNATVGLQAALIAIGVRGKRVAVSNFTFPATLHAIISAGGIPLICDIDESSWELTEKELGKALQEFNNEIKAVVVTKIFGMLQPQEGILNYCEENGLSLVFDSAAGFKLDNSYSSSKNVYEVFSFHATKPFGVGEGGFVVSNKENIQLVRQISNFALNQDQTFYDGTNSKADEFTAARVLGTIGTYRDSLNSRQEFAKALENTFSKYENIITTKGGIESTWGLFPLKFKTNEMLASFVELTKGHVLTRRYYYPTLDAGYKGDAITEKVKDLSISRDLASTILCVPVYFKYTTKLVREITNLYSVVCEELTSCLQNSDNR